MAAGSPAPSSTRDLLVTDMKHPVFPNFWPVHIIGYEHTFIAALGELTIGSRQ